MDRRLRAVIISCIIFAVLFPVMLVCGSRLEGAEIHGNMQFGYIVEIEGFEAEINVQYLPWHWLTFYAGINVLMEYSGDGSFYPFNDRYSVGAKINITENLYIDVYHHCSHPVSSTAHKIYYDRFTGGNKTRFAVGIEW